MSESWRAAIQALAEKSGWNEPATEKHPEALAYLIGASGKPDLSKKAVEEEIRREAETSRDVLMAQERLLKAEAMYEAAARPQVDVRDLGGYQGFLDAEEERARAEAQAAREEFKLLRKERFDSLKRLTYLHRVRERLEPT